MMDHLRTISMGGTSFTSFMIGVLTQSNIAWFIGVMAGLATIASGFYSYLQHKQRTELHEKQMEKIQTEINTLKEKCK